jgi:phosphoribosylaminoimidazole-succinocarboxamide synthase
MLDDTQRLQAFKQSLVSRGRVVTEQDYKMFCMNEVGTNITDVQLKKGFAISDNPSEGYINTIDEVLTPDSSRFWPMDQYEPGRGQPSFDKQYVRDWLEQSGWDKKSAPPALPEEVVLATSKKYIQIYEMLSGRKFKE